MTWAAVAVGGATLGSAAISTFGGKKSSNVTQVPLETPEQRDARQQLISFANNGTLGKYTAGTPYTGSLGDFGMSALENAAQGKVADRLNMGPDANFTMGSQTLSDLLTTDKYNPLNQEGVYSGLSGTIDRTTREASDAFKRSASFGGKLYSTDTVRNLGQIQARGAENKAATLASLYDNYVGRKVGAIPQAFNASAQAEDIARGRTADAFTYGGLQRNLNTAADQAKYAEFQRQRQEQQGQVAALSSVAGSNTNFGVPSVNVPQNDPWSQIAGLLAQFGGNYLGNKYGQKSGTTTTTN